MGKVSTLIGNVLDGVPKFNRSIDGEKFYTIDVEFKEVRIKVLMSEYVSAGRTFEDKISVTGCLMSDVHKGKLPVFYFYANAIESVDLDTELTNTINFTVTITKVREFKQNDRSKDILPLVGSNGSPLCATSVFYLCTINSLARRLKDVPKDYVLSGTGYLKAFRDVYEIYVQDAEIVKQ